MTPIIKVKLTDLIPYPRNKELFPDSLSPESIQTVADDLAKNGQGQPILISDVELNGKTVKMIVDGERRWRATKVLHEERDLEGWETIDAIELDPLTLDEVEGRVLDCFNSIRKPSLREKAFLYRVVKRRMMENRSRGERAAGAALSKKKVYQEAAEKVGLTSDRQARRLYTIFTEGSPELQERVNNGKTKIGPAMEELLQAANPSLKNVPVVEQEGERAAPAALSKGTQDPKKEDPLSLEALCALIEPYLKSLTKSEAQELSAFIMAGFKEEEPGYDPDDAAIPEEVLQRSKDRMEELKAKVSSESLYDDLLDESEPSKPESTEEEEDMSWLDDLEV